MQPLAQYGTYYSGYEGGSIFSGVIQFFITLGIYDVILPFLLVFTIVFAIFERTKVLGTEMVEGEEYSKKNLNAMIAFVMAFLVVASSNLVMIINQSLGNIVILIFVGVFFLLLVGIFYGEDHDGDILSKGWKTFFMILMFIGVLLIFLHAIPTSTGEPFLYYLFDYIAYNLASTTVSAILMILIVLGLMAFVIREPKRGSKKDD